MRLRRILRAAPLLAALALAAVAAADGARAQEDHFQTNLGGRFRLMEVDQPERDLKVSSRKLNVLFDAVTGRSWVLRYDVDPATNRDAYVWVEIPMVPPPPAE
jgi:hypothetical protein